MIPPALPYQPVQFGRAESALFGWYHPPFLGIAGNGDARRTGVVLCNPIGDDYIRAHRAFRHLALALSEAGFPVLRFDFRGTGDSSGSERDPGCAASWPEDVRLAAAEVVARSGAEKVALVGLRLGATLAVAAAAGARAGAPDIESVVLWHPFSSGAGFVDESTKLHRMHEALDPASSGATPGGWNAGGREAFGFLLTPDTVAMLGGIDLLAVRSKPAERALVIGASAIAADQKLAAHLKTLGTDVHFKHMPGHKFLVQTPHRSDLPTPVLQEIVGWLSEHSPAGSASLRPSSVTAATAQPFRYGEEPLAFGSSHPLFGMLVHPPKERQDLKRPAILICNSGGVHRIGPHRIYVPMARRWAALGFWVLRMDLSGLGDSPAPLGCQENLTYPRDGLADIADAMTAVTGATGASRFIVFGHCSGGDLAYQSALRDPRVVGALMLNPRTFGVNDLSMIESYKQARYYQGSILRAASWRKALRGDVDFGRAVGLVLPKVRDVVKRRVTSLFAGRVEDAESEDVALNLRKLAERGVDTFLLASEKDPGVDFIDVRQGRAMHALESVRGYRRQDFARMDHTFTSLYSQERLSEVLTNHLASRHLP